MEQINNPKPMRLILVLMACVWIGPSVASPAGTREQLQGNNESAKVSQIRDKLQRLHDLLKTSGGTVEQPAQISNSFLGRQDSNKGDDDGVVEDAHHLSKSRSITAEDMGRHIGIRTDDDDDEVALNQLAQIGNHVPTKRERPDFAQILARTLDRLSKHEMTKSETTKGGVQEDDAVSSLTHTSSSGYHGNAPSYNKDGGQTTSANRSNNRDIAHLEKLVHQLLTNLDGDTSDTGNTDRTPTALFHGSMKAPHQNIRMGNPYKTTGVKDGSDIIDDVTDDSMKAPHQSHRIENPYKTTGVKDGSDIIDDVTDDELYDFLIKTYAGTKADDAKKPKTKVMEGLESKLMEAIGTANQLGVSVDDLLQDLEERAFKEALLDRIEKILGPR